jgi:peptide/nickel transport system substrate-binding protein
MKHKGLFRPVLQGLFLAKLFILSGCFAKKEISNKIVVNLPAQQMQSLDPTLWAPQTVLGQGTLFEGLFGYNQDLNIEPKVSDSHTISTDKLTWTLALKKTKLWSNGDSLNAHDFIYAWKRFISPGVVAPMWASMFPDVVGAEEYKAGSIGFEGVGFKAVDDFTIEIKLKRPVDIIHKLVLGSAMPLHKKTLSKAKSEKKDWWKPANFVGNGPYLPTKFQADGEMTFEKNKNYIGYVGNVDIFVLKSGGLSVQVQNFEAEGLDLAHVLSLGDYKYVTTDLRMKKQVHEENELGFHGFQMARTVNPIVDNQKLRTALAIGIDKQTIAKAVMGNRVIPTDVYGPPSDSVLQGLKINKYNPDSAKKLLEESGYNQTKPVIYIFSPPSNDARGWASVTEALHSQWRELGVNVLIENMEDGMLTQYSWGSGFHKGEEFKRPGVTMYTGKILWKEPAMFLRLADHTWYYHNYPLILKEKLKAMAILAQEFSNLKKGAHPQDWDELDTLANEIDLLQTKVVALEKDSIGIIDLLKPNFKAAYLTMKSDMQKLTKPEKKVKAWVTARTFINDGFVKMETYLGNTVNLSGWLTLLKLRISDKENSKILIKQLQQQALDQAWIVPLYSEKLVYLKRPWIKNVVLNKFGAWLMAFNLQYIEVDKEAYKAAQ